MYSRDRLIKAIDNSACLTRRQIDDYLQKKLFPEELYVVEMHLNECPFCNDAIEGFGNLPNANAFLSKAEDFIFPALVNTISKEQSVAAKPNKSKIEPVVAKQNNATAQVEKKKVEREPVMSMNNAPEQKKSKKFSIPMGIAAGVVLALGVWGVSGLFKGDKANDASLTDASLAANQGTDQDGMFNESSINREEDSVMNAKYGFQNQAPLASTAKGTEYIRSRQGTAEVAAEEGVSMADEMTVAAAPAAKESTEKPNGFIGPVAPKDDEPKRTTAAVAVEKPKPVAATTSAAKPAALAKAKPEEVKAKTVAANKDLAKSDAAKAVKADVKKVETKEVAKKAEPPKKEAEKKEADKKTSAADPAVTQAEKDFSKGLDLYNKKQYSASIMYFQSAAKVKDFSKRKQAESYIKLAKSEVVNGERKKNSEK